MYGYTVNYPQELPYRNLEGDTMGSAYWVCMPQSEYQRINRYERREIEEAFFTLSFNLSKVPDYIDIHISAINLYRLYVNGSFCAYGPRKGDQYCHYYDTVDIHPYLKAGNNIIGVYVVSARAKALQVGQMKVLSATSVYSALDCIGLIVSGDAEEVDLSTGVAPWRVCIDESIEHHYYDPSDLLGSFETVDLQKIPAGWATESSCSKNWTIAEIMFKPGINYYGQIRALPLIPRPFKRPIQTTISFSRVIRPKDKEAIQFDGNDVAVIPAHSSAAIILDVGEHSTCFISTRLQGNDATVRFTYAESFLLHEAPIGCAPAFMLGGEDGPVYKLRRDDESGEIIGAYDEVISGDDTVYEPFRYRTFRFVRIDATTGNSPLILHKPNIRLTTYPLDIKTTVSSSDPNVEWLWESSLRTLRDCMHDTLESDSYYEQLQYIEDSKLMMDYIYAVSTDTAFASTTLWDFHSSLRPDGMLSCSYPSNEVQIIPGFSLQFIWMIERYYNHTGDKQIVIFYRPTIDAILGYFERHLNDENLCEGLGYWEFGDWTKQWNTCHGRPTAIQYGASTLFNLMYAYTLQQAAFLNKETARDGIAREYTERAQNILNAVISSCWVEERGMLCEAPGLVEFSQHCQVLGVLTGLLKGEVGHSALKNALADETVAICSLPWRYYLFRALEKYEMQDEMRERLDEFKKLKSFNLTTMPEWSLDGPRSDCHPWSCTPLYEFPATVLGVRAEGAGWRKIRIEPRPLGYTDFKGNVITPHGNVYVKWNINNSVIRLEINTPWETIVATPDHRRYCVQPGHYVFESPVQR